MKLISLEISDIKILEPEVYSDERGEFFEAYNYKKISELLGDDISFVQDNQSLSKKGVLRGLHYQINPCAQGKLVRVVRGEIFDVAVDLRRSSPTFGHYVSYNLSSDNKKQIWIPAGFAHGFLALSENVEVLYKTTSYYNPLCERCIKWDDPTIKIKWPKGIRKTLSNKDMDGKNFKDSEYFD
jgi:dTDP-4-dehydrorhamnose 3,5-epimerase